ncbi:hypothetical protein N665_1850s0001 [Sinapis alba]|nr:hypothetical protein N665_1850s0001 [Sinapis alba]
MDILIRKLNNFFNIPLMGFIQLHGHSPLINTSKSSFLHSDSDVAIKVTAEPEVEPAYYPTSLGANQDVCALKMPYLPNPEVFHHETNFHGSCTQGESNNNWNEPKIYPDQKYLNFSNWRFASPSICEGPSLEAISSLMKKDFDPKQIMDFKMDLLAFQEAYYQKNWPRNH